MLNDFYQPEGMQSNVNTSTHSGIELPFYAPSASWYNGNVAYSRGAGNLASFTGGWSMFAEAGSQIESTYGNVSNLFALGQRVLERDSKEVDAWLAQFLPVAVIRVRKRWIESEKPGGKASSHTQVLAYCGGIEGGKVIPAHPILLTVRGWQSDHLEKAIKKFESSTRKARVAASNGRGELLSSLFWMTIGTFGKTRSVISAGDKQIVPVKLYEPDGDYAVDTLRSIYVGSDIAEEINELGKQSLEWFNDANFKRGTKDQAQPVNGNDEMREWEQDAQDQNAFPRFQ